MTKEDIELMKRIREYAGEMMGGVKAVNAMYIPPAMGMRMAADAYEQKERDLADFDELIRIQSPSL